MKKQVILITTLCTLATSIRSQNYGEVTYPHPNHLTSSGELATINSIGFVTSLYEPNSVVESFNFIIDKTDDNGNFGGTAQFSKGYLTFGSSGCIPNSPQVLNCAGVSAIEINPQPIPPSTSQAWYAVAGTNSEGTFFSVLDNSGIPLNSVNYLHPAASGQNLLKPYIIESKFTPGEFYICGENGGQLYALKVDVMGNILWSSYYRFPFGPMHPKQIIECPYTGDLTVVGYCIFGAGPNRASDGFFLKLTAGTGGINVFKTYGHPQGACNEFHSINVANSFKGGSNGFIVGGDTDPLIAGRAWFVKVDPNGNLLWSQSIQGTTGVSWIRGVFERMNTMGMYENFGVGISFSGYTVLKLDDGGGPWPIGLNEFSYDAPGGIWSEPISMKEVTPVGPSPSEGIHIFGNEQLTTPGASYLVSAYFNGVSGCQNSLSNCQSFPGPNDVIQPQLFQTNGPILCTNYMIIPFDLNTNPNFICSGNSVPGGSNARPTGINEMNSQASGVAIYPNPVRNNLTLAFSGSGDHAVTITDVQGREVLKTQSTDQKIDINTGSFNNGIYFVRIIENGKTSVSKIVVNK